jgi:hypothetical protein
MASPSDSISSLGEEGMLLGDYNQPDEDEVRFEIEDGEELIFNRWRR